MTSRFTKLVLTISFFLFASSAPTHVRAEEKKKSLWIVSGQSNACGRAKLPGPDGLPTAKFFDPTKKEFVMAVDPLPGMGTTGVGPWVAAAGKVAKKGPAVDMVGFASGGKPISFWHPGNPGDVGLFPRIKVAGQGAEVFLWYQGESNTRVPAEVASYKDELKKLVERIRQAANNPKMLAVIVQLGAYTRDMERDFMGLREAQRQFVLEDGNAVLIPALGRPLKDAVHLNNAGYRELGAEIGRALLHVKYGLEDVNWPGPILQTAALSSDGKTVTAHFTEVEQLQGCTASDFTIVDREGAIPSRKAEANKTTVRLHFTRKIAPSAKLIYGYGNNPKATLVDEAGNRAPAIQIPVTK